MDSPPPDSRGTFRMQTSTRSPCHKTQAATWSSVTLTTFPSLMAQARLVTSKVREQYRS